MGEADKKELFWLVDLAMGIVHPDDVENYTNKVEDKLNKGKHFLSTIHHLIKIFSDAEKETFWKHCGKKRRTCW